MDWRRSCSIGTMQIGKPSEVQRTIPVAWYFAPPGAKTFYGVNAFVSGLEDRDTPALPPLLGMQPPYASPYSTGRNVWGYLGQCMVGTPDQYANGLTAEELAAPPLPIPACCAAPVIGQTWFLRHDLTPKNTVVPGVFVGSIWDNIGSPVVAGMLSDTPGQAPEAVTFNVALPTGAANHDGFVQYISAPLPAQTIAPQQWLLTIGRAFAFVGGFIQIGKRFVISVIDGVTGLQKAELVASTIGQQPMLTGGEQGEAAERILLQADIAYGDYLCVEIGWGAFTFPPHLVSYTANIIDSGTHPISPPDRANSSPMAVLQWPVGGGDLDMPIVGTIVPFAGPLVPHGYLPCDGSVRNAADFPALFAAIGTTWGVGAPGTFQVPDLRDRAVIGTSPGGLGTTRPSIRNLADVAGEETHALLTQELATHAHTVTDPGHFHSPADGSQFICNGATANLYRNVLANHGEAQSDTSTEFTLISIDNTGGDIPHNNMQPFAVVTWLIKW